MKAHIATQLSLFDRPSIRLASVGRAVKLALNRAASESNLSREEIVYQSVALADEAGISLCQGGRLTIATLNKWLDVNAQGYMPGLLALTALCQILGDTRALRPILEALSLEAIGPEDQRYRDIGKTSVQMKALRKRMKELEK